MILTNYANMVTSSNANTTKTLRTIATNPNKTKTPLFIIQKPSTNNSTIKKPPTATITSNSASTSTSMASNIATNTTKTKTETDQKAYIDHNATGKALATALKKDGLIRISIHRSNMYTNAEMCAILRHLNVQYIVESDSYKNIIVAAARTGTLTHVQDISDEDCPDICARDEFGSLFDQDTQTPVSYFNKQSQVTQEDINREIGIVNSCLPPPTPPPATPKSPIILVDIPPLIEHPRPTIPGPIKPDSIRFNEKAFKNYSNVAIPENIAILISNGPKFSAPLYYQKKDFELLSDAANTINYAFSNVFDVMSIRQNIQACIAKYEKIQFTHHCSEIKDYYSQALESARKFFRKHPDIIVTQADKANCTIVMNRKTYNDKLENLLKDEETYYKVSVSCLPAYQNKNKELLDELVAAGLTDKRSAQQAFNLEQRTANMYALIKTHKEGAPPRPIVNTRNTPGYFAAQLISKLLSNVKETGKYNVLNSQHAIEKIKAEKPLPGDQFVSFDVKSMFTNISVKRAIAAVLKKRKQLKVNDEQMRLIIKTIQFVCTTSTEITFNGVTYKQIKGLRMGSSLSPILADFVMEDILDHAFLSIERPVTVMKYVDDLLFLVHKDRIDQLFIDLNKEDEHIKFDIEKEDENHSINYLDFTIINKRLDLSTKWYQKHIASGRFLNYLSHHPQSVIINTAITFVVTMYKNTSHIHVNEIYKEITDKAKYLLRTNSFPDNIVNDIIIKAGEKIFMDMNTSQAASAKKDSQSYGMSVPHIPGLTNKVKKLLESQSERITPSRPIHKLSQEIFNPSKTSTPQNQAIPMAFNVVDQMDLTPE